MGKTQIVNVVVAVLMIALGIYYYGTINYVPFHPDESTYIFMSSDFKEYFSDPVGMTYDQKPGADIKQHYRLIDPPITRYWIGAAGMLAGLDGLKTDWNWSSDWQSNVAAGAFPQAEQLFISRLSVSCLYLLALYAIFKTGVLLRNPLTGIVAMLMLGANALVLLHTRRAMEEALLLPALCVSLWAFTSINRRPWLAGLVVMLAINVKSSALPFYFIGVAAIFLLDQPRSLTLSRRLSNLLIFTTIILAGTYLLNPVAWLQPGVVLKQAVIERSELVRSQVVSLQQINAELVLDSPGKRLAGFITHLFFSYPAALDVGNYRDALSMSITAYNNTFGTSLLRGVTGGLIAFCLTLFGSLLMLLHAFKQRPFLPSFRLVILVGFSLMLAAMLATISIPFQRYVLPLLPFISLFSAYGISQIFQPDERKAPA